MQPDPQGLVSAPAIEMLAPTGLHLGLGAFAAVAAALAAAGLAASRFLRLDADPRPARPPRTRTGDVIVTAAAFGIVANAGRGFRRAEERLATGRPWHR